ncbi:MAG: hypothetical protein AB1762_17355, partial [Gemmatimonadota bacterium]
PWTPPTFKAFTGEAAPLVGRYKGPSRGREMNVEVTQSAQGIAISVNGSTARPVQWVEASTFRQGNTFLHFRHSGDGRPATELRFDAGGGYYILKRQ